MSTAFRSRATLLCSKNLISDINPINSFMSGNLNLNVFPTDTIVNRLIGVSKGDTGTHLPNGLYGKN